MYYITIKCKLLLLPVEYYHIVSYAEYGFDSTKSKELIIA